MRVHDVSPISGEEARTMTGRAFPRIWNSLLGIYSPSTGEWFGNRYHIDLPRFCTLEHEAQCLKLRKLNWQRIWKMTQIRKESPPGKSNLSNFTCPESATLEGNSSFTINPEMIPINCLPSTATFFTSPLYCRSTGCQSKSNSVDSGATVIHLQRYTEPSPIFKPQFVHWKDDQ